MTGTDPFEHDDAAYVLGALDDGGRRAFEAHLPTCAACQARVAELRDPAALLTSLPPAAGAELLGTGPRGDETAGHPAGAGRSGADPMPDTLLPGLLRRARRERLGRRLITTGVGAVAAACLLTLAVVLWPGGSSTPPAREAAARTMVAVQPSPLSATARLTARAWGTQIDVHCSYPAYDRDRFAYRLVVIDKLNQPHQAGDWTLVPGQAGIDFTSGTSVVTSQIARVQILTPSGTPLLELRL